MKPGAPRVSRRLQHEIDADQRERVSKADAQRIKDHERESRELRKATRS